MPIPETYREYWQQFVQACGEMDDKRYYDVCQFGDSEALVNELNALVLSGIKRATAGSLSSYEDRGIRAPKPGDLSIVTDWFGAPVCIIETRSVDVLPYDEVTAEFAAIEGEGDGSLAFWRDAHRKYFERECRSAGRPFDLKMLLACETFSVVYPP